MAPRTQTEAQRMTEALNTAHLRLTDRFAFYDEHGSYLWREWPEGAIVTDPSDIKLLEARGAPVERIVNRPETFATK
jgi:hypothetical protein